MRADALLWGTAGTGAGGSVLAVVTQSPGVTFGAIVLAGIGLASLWVREYYSTARERLDATRMHTELEVYRRMCANEHHCPFSPDGVPACAAPDQLPRPE